MIRALLTAGGVLALLFGSAYVVETNFFNLIPYSLEKYADNVIATCARNSYPPACYDTEIPKLMDRGLSMEDAFAVTRIIQSKVDNYFYCHVLGHRLSEKETAKDPSKWTEVVGRCPAGMCSNGCLHGAAQERFRNDVLMPAQVQALLPELANVCELGGVRDFTGLEQASCYHSLGHLSMYITGADTQASTAVCDSIGQYTEKDFRKNCYEGAYMQIFQPLEPEDIALVQGIPATTTESASAFCNSFTGEKRDACNRESWPLYQDTFGELAGIETFCSLASTSNAKRYCYSALFYILTAQYNFDIGQVTKMCEQVVPERMGQCFASASSRFIETDYQLIPNAVALCAVAQTHGVGDRCYKELLFYSTYNFHVGSDEFTALCSALPEPWRSRCLAGGGDYIQPNTDDV